MELTTPYVKYESYPSTEWVVDFETGMNNEPLDNMDAIAQDFKFALGTERYKYPIMGKNFGVTLDDLIGRDDMFIESEIKNRIEDCLSIDDRVESIDSWKFTRLEDNGLLVEFTIHCYQGNVPMEVKIGQ
jgi:hypothetical protein